MSEENQESREATAAKTDVLGTVGKLELQLPTGGKFSLASIAPLSNRRKFSFPASLHSNLLGLSSEHSAAKRRFSNVGDVVSRYLLIGGVKKNVLFYVVNFFLVMYQYRN